MLFSALFLQKNAFFFKKILVIQKKAVLLHPLSKREQCSNTFAMIAQLVEHDLAKVGVASSSLVHRSRSAGHRPAFFKPRWRNW